MSGQPINNWAADAERPDEPAPPLIAPTGNTSVDVMADVINRAAAPFQDIPPPEEGHLKRANVIVNGILGAIQMPVDLLNAGFALATKDIAKVFPPMPAATLGMLHVGWPHGHTHPPSFIPPAPPVPLPSMGPVLLAGCVSVLINGVPAARAGDIGFSVLCGSFTPPFEVFTGSSKVFIGGGRAARMLDITKHCQPGAAAGKAASMLQTVAAGAGVGLGVAALGAQGLDVATKASDGDGRGAAIAGAQLAADAAALAIALLMGLDPGIPPCFGALVAGHPNVLVGGFPMPPWLSIATGLAKLGNKLKGGPPPRTKQNDKCTRPGEPIDPITGAAVDEHVDFEASGAFPFRWGRSYSSADADREGPVGRGFRHTYERSLAVDLDRVVYTDEEGREVPFFGLGPDREEAAREGYRLRRRVGREETTYELSRPGEPTMVFVRPHRAGAAPLLVRLTAAEARAELLHDERGRLAGILETSAGAAIETRLVHDDRGRVIEVRRGPHGARTLPRVVAYAYDHAGCLVAWEDALGARGSYRYDAAHRMVQKTDRNGYSFHYAYDEQGRCVEERGDDGLFHVTLRYEPERRRTVVTTALGGTWVYEYDRRGTIVSIHDPCGGEHRRMTDGEGKVVLEVLPGGQGLERLYDDAGGHVGVVDGFGHEYPPADELPDPPDPLARHIPEVARDQHWGLALGEPPAPEEPTRRVDALGQVVEEVDAAGRRRSWEYDRCGNPVRYRDRDGREHVTAVTSWNLAGAEVDPLGNRTEHEYAPHAAIARVIDAGGAESRYEYDAKGRLARVVRHGVVREAYAHDLGDRLIEKRSGAGEVLLTRVIGANGLPSERRLASGEVYRYGYDRRGRVVRASSRGAVVRREFDEEGRLIRDERNGRGVRHRFEGDELRETTYLGRFTVSYGRAPDGALVIEAPAGGAHRIRRGDRGSVLVELGNGTRISSAYDDEGRCLERAAWRAGDGGRERWTAQYTYSAEGDLLRVSDSARGVTDYEYDAAHRLIGESRPGGAASRIVLDAAGNILEKPGLSGVELLEGNRLRAAGRERFRYDERNHLAEHDDGAGGVTRYRYDSLDMLVGISWSGRDEAWTAAYDGLRRRVHKALGGRRTEYYWDGDRLAAEIGPAGELRIYVYPGPEALVPLLFVDYDGIEAAPGSGRVYHVFSDQIGLPLRIEDQAGRTVWWADHVEPYGAITVPPGALIRYAPRFPGHYLDEETGLHENRHRYYSPRLGRYLQSDPAGQSGGVNLYAYPPSPLVHVDVLGLSSSCNPPTHGAGRGDGDGESPGPRKGWDKFKHGAKKLGKKLQFWKKDRPKDTGKGGDTGGGKGKEKEDPGVKQQPPPPPPKPALTPVDSKGAPVPKQISYIWFGGPIKDVNPKYLDDIRNTVDLHRNDPDADPSGRWSVNVVLSKTFSKSPEAFAANKAALEDAGASVVVLEDRYGPGLADEGMMDPLRWEWSGDHPNYGAMTDIVRVYMLKRDGGVYTDTDNTFLKPLPGDLGLAHGFKAGVSHNAALVSKHKIQDVDSYKAALESDQPTGIINAFLASEPDGKIINAYWDHIKDAYRKLPADPEARHSKLHGDPADVRAGTMYRSGPSGMRAFMSSMSAVDGRNLWESMTGWDLTREGLPFFPERQDLLLDPSFLYIRSDNSWIPKKAKPSQEPAPLAQEAHGEGSGIRAPEPPITLE